MFLSKMKNVTLFIMGSLFGVPVVFAQQTTTEKAVLLKSTITNASGLNQYNISIDYLPNTVDRELEFDLDNAHVGATILINPRHLSGVVKLTRANSNITFNGYSQLTKVSSTPFYITHIGNDKWVL